MNRESAARDLVVRAGKDLQKRQELAATGALFDGYHPDMEALHVENARALDTFTRLYGWPAAGVFGPDVSDAAWLITQHAISLPDFQRTMLGHIQHAAADGKSPAWQAAYLEDRIRVMEGRPQIYGTQFDWDDQGTLSPLPVEEPEMLDARRAAVGLEPIAEKTRKMRDAATAEGNTPPENPQQRRNNAAQWAKKAGWR